MADADDLSEFTQGAQRWLDAHVPRREPSHVPDRWGAGSDDVSVFHDLDGEQERSLVEAAMAWQREKYDGGYGALTWPRNHGGAGLTPRHQAAFDDLEAGYLTPAHHEVFSVTLHLVAPTVAAFGSSAQRAELLGRFLRTTDLCCQLFSEPGAGSDLAGLSTRAVRDGADWIVTGQKTWSSGAHLATWGEVIARTDLDVPKHVGLTAFLIPMDLPGITVVPIRQMSGGSSFNEVFFDAVRVPDSMRLGAVGEGWKVALTTLGFERSSSGADQAVGGSWAQLRALAEHLGVTGDPVVRQALAQLYSLDKVRFVLTRRSRARVAAGGVPGPEESIAKLLWTTWMTAVGEAATSLLGARALADSGEWGTYAWTQHLLGAPGYRIAGGSDEIQRNIIGERVLGLPREPRTHRDAPFRDIPR